MKSLCKLDLVSVYFTNNIYSKDIFYVGKAPCQDKGIRSQSLNYIKTWLSIFSSETELYSCISRRRFFFDYSFWIDLVCSHKNGIARITCLGVLPYKALWRRAETGSNEYKYSQTNFVGAHKNYATHTVGTSPHNSFILLLLQDNFL